jgi:hypothetical protein
VASLAALQGASPDANRQGNRPRRIATFVCTRGGGGQATGAQEAICREAFFRHEPLQTNPEAKGGRWVYERGRRRVWAARRGLAGDDVLRASTAVIACYFARARLLIGWLLRAGSSTDGPTGGVPRSKDVSSICKRAGWRLPWCSPVELGPVVRAAVPAMLVGWVKAEGGQRRAGPGRGYHAGEGRAALIPIRGSRPGGGAARGERGHGTG